MTMEREEATKLLKALNMMLRSPDGEPISDACDALDMAIEALTERTGEWEDKEIFNDTNDDHIVDEWQSARCSVCGKYHTTPYMYYFDNFNFCPNCGARMKGGEDE